MLHFDLRVTVCLSLLVDPITLMHMKEDLAVSPGKCNTLAISGPSKV